MSEDHSHSDPARKSRALAASSVVGRLALGAFFCCMTGWALLAIAYAPAPGWLRLLAGAGFAAGALCALVLTRSRWRGRLAFLALFAAMTAWWLGLAPSNDRDWQPDVAVLPYAVFDGSRVTVHNVRNCDYRSETDFDARYDVRTYDLDHLRTADLSVAYWGSPRIAHTIMSFGFDGGEYLSVSIETRKEKGEAYSAVRGFFKQYELVYVVADERDLIRLRTNYRGEDVYLYRLQITPEAARTILLSYLDRVNRLKDQPEWYNAATSNCTTNIRGHARAYTVSSWDWRILLNGYLDEMAYENGRLDRSLPFGELKARSHINRQAQAADRDPAFSRRIRESLPGMEKP